jgi:2-keto-4-pentenoate hydratase
MVEVWERAEGLRGVSRQLAALDTALASGTELFGWKLGLGAPASLEAFEIAGPCVGYLLAENVESSPASVKVSDMTAPKAEPEVAVRLSRPLHGDESDADIMGAIASVALAFEIVDIAVTTRDIETVLAVNIFQQAVVMGSDVPGELPDLSEGLVEVLVNGEVVRRTEHPAEMTGETTSLLRYTARWLSAAGRTLDSGDVVILGSTVPPIDLRGGDRLTYRRSGFSPVDMSVA